MKVVAIGGGTGLSALLRGLKLHVPDPLGNCDFSPAISRLTAVVTVTDEGGSSGRLRREFAMPPPGDIRNCLVALAEDEWLFTQLFNFRSSNGRAGRTASCCATSLLSTPWPRVLHPKACADDTSRKPKGSARQGPCGTMPVREWARQKNRSSRGNRQLLWWMPSF